MRFASILAATLLCGCCGCSGSRLPEPPSLPALPAPIVGDPKDCGKPVYKAPVPHINTNDGDVYCTDKGCEWRPKPKCEPSKPCIPGYGVTDWLVAGGLFVLVFFAVLLLI